MILTLDGTAQQVGWLSSARWLPYLVLGLLVGALVDRRRRRPLMVSTDLTRAVLLTAIPVNVELYYQASAVGTWTLQIMPSFVAVTAWYLILCSVLMVGQSFLERRFGRGFGTTTSPGAMKAKMLSWRGGGGGL